MREGYIEFGMMSRTSDDAISSYVSHLEELRARIVYSLLAVAAGVAAGWWLTAPVYRLLAEPLIAGVVRHGGDVITLHPGEFFFTKMKIAGVLGVLLASPVVLWQLWAFVRPGLTPREQRAVRPLLPAVCGLFLFGAGVAYLMLPNIMAFFLGYSDSFPGVSVTVNFQQSIDFPLKILLAFGFAFQLPVLLLGLVWLGVLTPRFLLAQWRYAVLAMGVLAGVITPTGDPLTWGAMLAPLLLLYFGTIWLAFRLSHRAGEGGQA